MNGKGILTFKNDGYYQGDWKNGQMDGLGCLNSNGTFYEGQFVNNIM